MVIPLQQYVHLKDSYYIGYFGEDIEIASRLFKARDLIEKEFEKIKVYLIFKDSLKSKTYGKRNVIYESNLGSYRKKIACFSVVKDINDIEKILFESKIDCAEYIN